MLDLGMLRQEFLNSGVFNFSFLFSVDLVANKNEGEFFRFFGSALVQKLSDPGFDVVKRLDRSGCTRLFVMS